MAMFKFVCWEHVSGGGNWCDYLSYYYCNGAIDQKIVSYRIKIKISSDKIQRFINIKF